MKDMLVDDHDSLAIPDAGASSAFSTDDSCSFDTMQVQHENKALIRNNKKGHTVKSKKRCVIGIVICLAVVIIACVCIAVFYIIPSNKTDSQNCQFKHPQYPFLGGGGCSQECYSDEYSSPPLNIKLSQFPSSFSAQFQADYQSAGALLEATGFAVGTTEDYPIQYDFSGMHMTLDYFCCYSPLEIETIDALANNFTWPSMNLTMDELICTHNDVSSSIELMVLLDDASQQILLPIVEKFEQQMATNGLIVNVPRQNNIGFHVTLARVDQSVVPVNSVVDTINRNIQWSKDTNNMFNDSVVCPGPGNSSSNSWQCLG